MSFHVGQKVCCVLGTSDTYLLVEGEIYTISGAGPFGGVVMYDVAEVKTHVPRAWLAHRFRPLVERKTSIEIFKRMLLPSKQGVEA